MHSISLALVDAHRLQELAAWQCDLAARAGNRVIWERRLPVAEDPEAEAARIELAIRHNSSGGSDG